MTFPQAQAGVETGSIPLTPPLVVHGIIVRRSPFSELGLSTLPPVWACGKDTHLATCGGDQPGKAQTARVERVYTIKIA